MQNWKGIRFMLKNIFCRIDEPVLARPRHRVLLVRVDLQPRPGVLRLRVPPVKELQEVRISLILDNNGIW